jgi:hypothetical protein
MPKYFCEYCGIYLTHSNPRGRQQHSHGRKHINNKIEYYSQFLSETQNHSNNNNTLLAFPPVANEQNGNKQEEIKEDLNINEEARYIKNKDEQNESN